MFHGHRNRAKLAREVEATNELIGLLNAISIVSSRLAKKLALLRTVERKRGAVTNV